MKWTVKLVTEVVPGKPIEEEVATIERENLVSAHKSARIPPFSRIAVPSHQS